MRGRLVPLALSLILVACSPGSEALPQLGVDLDETSVSGLSAGAYMAGQLQVAQSSHIVGAVFLMSPPWLNRPKTWLKTAKSIHSTA